ncbi:hypothetical protein OJAV_G00203670 [Oryzias javanicus]|uniref:Uncharacterized protein n=1 Tax=Oryzias javanicus TaxID=123683 RepID=A0A3S2MFC5_ORYJA|nr:hypothetical protein OJAV_G00203670 [Oryzias javanicus]
MFLYIIGKLQSTSQRFQSDPPGEIQVPTGSSSNSSENSGIEKKGTACILLPREAGHCGALGESQDHLFELEFIEDRT